MLGYSAVWSLQFHRHAPQEKPSVWESVVTSVTWAGISFKMAPGFSEEKGQEEDVWVLPRSQWNTTTVFIRVPWNTLKHSPLYTLKPQWRFPYLLSWRAQLQLEERTSWSSRIGSDLREPIVQLVLSETNTVQPEKTCNWEQDKIHRALHQSSQVGRAVSLQVWRSSWISI
jgi:hypothetical protein